MAVPVAGLAKPFRVAENRLVRNNHVRRREWRRRLHRGHVWFDEEIRHAHRALRQNIPSFIRESPFTAFASAPIIYSMVIPLLLLDLWITLYQWICFPIYGIAHVSRRRHIVVDRHRLGYLNGIEKLNCAYCGYANGLFSYVREVAARTEQYWCPIKHARRLAPTHGRYRTFFDYGDARGYRRGLVAQRRALKSERRRR